MEVRVSFIVAEHGHDAENGERFMSALMSVFPEGGPSVSQNVRTGTLTSTFALEAADAPEAARLAVDIFVEAATATGLPLTPVVGMEAAVVMADDLIQRGELQPA